MRCDCLDGYVGHNCETRLLDTLNTGDALSQSDIFICFILEHGLFVSLKSSKVRESRIKKRNFFKLYAI